MSTARPLVDVPEEALAEKFRATRENAFFEELFLRNRDPIYRRCLAVVRDRGVAEDLVQETFKRALEKIDLFGGGNFSAWLMTIARNVSLNHLRDDIGRRLNGGPPDFDRFEAVNAGDPTLAYELQDLIRQLPWRQRVCLKLLYVEGLSYREIAAVAGFSYNDVKSHVQNGRRRVREMWIASQEKPSEMS